jgi:hypothetical protein
MTKAEIRTSAKRLLLLADFLEELPPGRFDYAQWAGMDWQGKEDLSCGTSACALGWATTMPVFRRLGLRLVKNAYGLGAVCMAGQDTVTAGIDTSFNAAAEVFKLDDEEAEFLFGPERDYCGDESPREDALPSDVAAHIRAFVAKHRAVTP